MIYQFFFPQTQSPVTIAPPVHRFSFFNLGGNKPATQITELKGFLSDMQVKMAKFLQ